MAINNYRVQVATAYPGVTQVPSTKGTTFRCDILTEDRDRKEAFVKLLRTEDVAKEILCATLARLLHLPIKQAYYVEVDPAKVEGRFSGNIHHIAFGLERDYYPTFRLTSSQLENDLLAWPEALACATFDEWIFNTDRLPQNLLYVKNGEYWLIDHDEALPNAAKFDESANSGLLQLISKNKSELELYRLRNLAMSVVEEYEKIDWIEVYDLLRVNVFPQCEPSFRKYIDFLQRRTPNMSKIITESIGIKQQEMKFSQPISRKNEINK